MHNPREMLLTFIAISAAAADVVEATDMTSLCVCVLVGGGWDEREVES